jgi:hypothetical protein
MMLKLNYSDAGLFLEWVSASVEVVVTQQVMLAVAVGQSVYLEPGRASFLLPETLPGLGKLQRILQPHQTPLATVASTQITMPSVLTVEAVTTTEPITIAPVDQGFVEVSLQGTWIAQSATAESGTFITSLSPQAEALIYHLWQTTQRSLLHAA